MSLKSDYLCRPFWVIYLYEQVGENHLRLEDVAVDVAVHRIGGDESGMNSLAGNKHLDSLTTKLDGLSIGIGHGKRSLGELHLTGIDHIVLTVDDKIYLHTLASGFTARHVRRLHRSHASHLQCLLYLAHMTETKFLEGNATP